MMENIQGFDQVPAHASNQDPDRKLVILDSQDFVNLDALIREEAEARERLDAASKRRDRFCLEMEKKHNLGGLSWIVDHDKKGCKISLQSS